MNYVNEGLYFEASNLANSLSKDVGRYCSLPVEKVKCFHIQEYVEQVEDVDIFTTSINNLLKQDLDLNQKRNLISNIVDSIEVINDEIYVRFIM